MKRFLNMFNQMNRCGSKANLNLFRYTAKSCDSQGVVTATSYGASDEHPMSIRSASDGRRRQNRIWKYAAMLLCLLTIGVGNAWANSSKTYYSKMNATITSGQTGYGTVYVTSTGKASDTKNSSASSAPTHTYNIYATANAGYKFTSWSGSGITFGSTTTANTTGAFSASSTSSGSPTTKTATASFEVIKVTAAPADVNINATDPSATYPENTDERTLTFTTTSNNALTDFTYAPANGASGKFTFSNWRRVDATHVAVDYTFSGGGNYGGLTRTNQVSVTLKGVADATTKTCTITATFPNAKVTGGSDVSLTSSFKATDATQAGKSWTAVFDVENVDYVSGDNNNFDTPTFTGTDAARFSLDPTTPMSYADGKVTVNFIYNGNKEATTHTATLTLKVKDAIGGTDATYGSKSVTVTAVNKEEANYDVDVYNASGTKISNNTTMWADGITLAKNNPGSTIVLARNINLGTITAAYEISKNTTIDLNGKELRAGVNKKEIGILNVNGTGITLTIKDDGLGGGGVMINEYALNNQMRTITVTKGTLTLEGGTIAVNNTTQYRYGTTDYTDGIANVVSMSTRAIHQAAGTTVNIKGGKVQSKASRNGYCIYQASSAATQRAETSVLNISDGEIYSECSNRAYGVAAYGLVNLSGGTITAKLNTETVNANTVYVNKYPTDASYVIHNYTFPIRMYGGASITAANNYYGVLKMTGGEVVAINENVHATPTTNLEMYGIYFDAGSVNVKTGTASDETYSQKWAAVGDISGGSVRVENKGTLAYGIRVFGAYNSHDDSHTVTKIKNCTIDVTAYQSAYGVYANASVGTTSNSASPNMGACYAGDVELTNTTVNATATDGTTAYALMVVSTYGTVFKNATMTKATDAGYTQVYDGEFASAAKMTVNSGDYTAETKKSSSAYAAVSSTRSRTIFASTTSTNANRELGGHKQAYAELNIHGGTFRATTSTSEARAVSVGGHTTIDGGHFYANAGSSTARGIYCVSGTLKVSGVDVHSEANSSAFGISLSGGISDNTGFSYSADAELNNLTVDVKTRTGNEADGVLMEVTKKNLPTIPTSGEYMNIYQKGEYAIAPKAIINGGTYTVTSQGTSAYGVSLNSAPLCEDINGDGILAIGEGDLTIKNAEFTVETKTGNAAYGVWAGGKTSVENTKFTITSATSDAYGLRAYYGKSTIKNSTFDVTATTATAVGLRAEARMSTVNSSNSHHTTNFSGVEGYDLIGEIESEGNTVTVRADGGNTAYGLQVISAKGTGTKTTAAAGLAFKGDHACAGTATINGGKYTATASGTTAYAIIVSAPATQGAETAIPSCTVNDGKFYGYATGGTYADLSPAGEPGYFVLNGGYYVKDENIDVKLGEGMNKVEVKSGTPEYTEGYRWRVTDNMTGEIVCKVYNSSNSLLKSYQTLEEALAYVNLPENSSTAMTIVMCGNYTLSKGDYELPSGKTLLVPYKSSGTGKGATQAVGTSYVWVNYDVAYKAPTPLYKLTFAKGVNMTVKSGAAIEASSVIYVTNGSNGAGLTTQGTGIVHDKYGWIDLEEGAYIDLESGSNLYVWGYITGKGHINAKNGSAVYEDFQMGDWRGGTMEKDVQGNKNGLNSKGVFLITHYYYQNIECPITYRAGSNAYALGGTAVNAFGATNAVTDPAVQFIGTSNSMFLLNPATAGEDTWVRKEYDPETDYVNWYLNSGAEIGGFSLKMSAMGLSINVKASDYVLPITSNFNIIANYGDVKISNDVCFIPGSKLTIKKEANVIIPSDKRVYFYDQNDWSSYSGYWFCPGYSPSWKTNPRKVLGANTTIKMPDADVLVEGKMTIRGSVYTTAGGANIHSTRENAGKVIFEASAPASTVAIADFTGNSGQNQTLCQLVGNGSAAHYVGKALTAAKLQNESGDPTSTTGAVSGDIYAYMEDPADGVYRWISVVDNGCFTEYKGSSTKQYIHPSDFVAVEANANGDHAYHSEDGTRMFVNAEKKTTESGCVWWEVDPTPQVIGGTTYYVANNENFDNFGTYFYWDNSTSYWKPKKVTVIWKDKDGNKITNGTFGDEYDFNTSPVYQGTNPTWANTAIEKHDWIGWRDPDGNIYDKNATLPRATEPITYTAYFVTSKYQSTITFKNPDNTVIWAGLVDKGDVPVCPISPTMASTVSTDYTFAYWEGYQNAELPVVAEAATYTAHYTETTRQYTVTFYNYDSKEILYQVDVDYNTRPTYAGITPYRANTSVYSYGWTGWLQGTTPYGINAELAKVTGNVSYIATFEQTELQYQVFFKRPDGSVVDALFLPYEATPDAFPADPTMTSTVSTDYTFTGWIPAELAPVTEDGMVYTAQFSESPRQYTAHFVNYDGKTLNADQTIDYNTVPAYTGATPMKPNDSRNSFEFSGWAWAAGDGWEAGSIAVGEAFPAIKGDITFTAQFNPVLLQFNVVFQHEDGTQIDVLKKKYGNKITISDAPDASKDATAQYTYTFDRWEPALTATEVEVTKDLTYTALFNEAPRSYSVTLNTNEGTINAGNVKSYTYGTSANLPTNVTRTGYDFDGWYDNSGFEGSAVKNISSTATGDKEYWARWTIKKFTVIWKNEDGSTLETDTEVPYDTEPTYDGATPTKAADASYVYTFDKWSPAVGSISGNTEYVATYTSTPTVASVSKEGETTTYHATIADAIAAANSKSGATVTMLQNATTTSELTISAAMTIDLNGKTISSTQAAATGVFKIDAQGKTVTITDSGTDGKIDHTANYGGYVYGINLIAGSLNITDGTIYAENTKDAVSSSSYRAIGIYYATGNTQAASVTMSNGTVEAKRKQTYAYAICLYTANCELTVTGGEVKASGTGKIRGIYTQGTATLSNAIVSATASGTEDCYAVFSDKTGQYTINSGTYTATGAGTDVYAISVTKASSASVGGSVTVKGGKFGGKSKELYVSGGTASVKGGYYVHNTGLADNCATNYHVLPASLTEGGVTYNYKVVEAYKVTFKNGTTTLQDTYVEKGNAPAYVGNEPTKAATAEYSYAFDGWSTTEGGAVVNPLPDVYAAAAYYAHFSSTPNPYTLTWDVNGGDDLTGDYTYGSTAYGTTIVKPADPTKIGYTFADWTPSVAATMPAANTTYTATWTPSTNTPYVVKHYKENLDGTYSSEPDETDNLTGTTGAEVTPAVKDYTGFTAPSTQTVTILADGSLVVEYYYTRNSHKVTWDATTNGGSCETAYSMVKHGATIGTLPEATKTGHDFQGWFTTYTGGGNQVTASTVINSVTTAYARFAPSTYDITYKDQDDADFSGVHSDGYPTTHTYGTVTALVNPTKYGYTFEGWYDNAACTGTALTEIGATAYTADFILYAKWTIKSNCTIRWVNYNGDLLCESTIQREGTPNYPNHGPVPTKPGDDNRTYTFIGWSPEIHAAYDDETYTAQYSLSITTGEPGTYTVSGTEDAVATTVQVSGKLNVSSGTLTTGDLIVEASSDGSGTIDGIGYVTVTGDAYFDYEFNVDPWHWSAFGVPFEIDLDAAAPLKEKTSPLGIVGPDDYDIVYYDTEERAAHGASKNCWKYVDNETTHRLIPGRLYMIAFDKHVGHVGTVRFKKAAEAPVNSTTPVQLITTGPAGGNNNWNGIANPMMYHALLGAGVTECQVHDGGEIGKDGYYTYNMTDKKFFVGKAAFVQVPQDQDPVVVTPADGQDPLHAPRRTKAVATDNRYDVQIASTDGAVADRLLILAEEDKADEYVIVSDLAKAGVSPVRAQMWVDRYGEKLCKNTTAYINNKANYPLVISAPTAGEYEIFINELPDNETTLYLTYNGKAIWNLNYSAYAANLEKGTTNNYGLRMVRVPKVGTGIEEATIQNGDAVRKVIVEDKVFIIRNGEMYSITGQKAQ